MLIYLDNVLQWDILSSNLKTSTTKMRTSTRRGFLREPAERWKAGGNPDAEWTSELPGEREIDSPRRNRHRYRAGGFRSILESPDE
jgi:hypothetical protein